MFRRLSVFAPALPVPSLIPFSFQYWVYAIRSVRSESKKGSAVSRGALKLEMNYYASVITGTAPADSGTCADTE